MSVILLYFFPQVQELNDCHEHHGLTSPNQTLGLLKAKRKKKKKSKKQPQTGPGFLNSTYSCKLKASTVVWNLTMIYPLPQPQVERSLPSTLHFFLQIIESTDHWK